MSNLTPSDIALMVNEFGKVSFLKLLNVMNRLEDGVLVDIGIYHGASSRMMLDSATKNRNKIFAIDPIPSFSSNHPNYTYIKGDSVKVGRE